MFGAEQLICGGVILKTATYFPSEVYACKGDEQHCHAIKPESGRRLVRQGIENTSSP
jgi:hypothetical protein